MVRVFNFIFVFFIFLSFVFFLLRCSDSATGSGEDVLNCPDGTKPYGKKCISLDSGTVKDEEIEEDIIVEGDAAEPEEDIVIAEDEVKDTGPTDKGNPKVCNPKERQCIKGDLYECNGDGTKFIMIESCQLRCDIVETSDAGIETKYCITKLILDYQLILFMHLP
ncbi:MAG: hypothetical protein N3B13_10475 [Deltaproteobacteria bacterium]|nr:hypothetical protein [Deltaproteobacteria bacterium]